MITRLKLNPGQKGTKKLLQKYGERLVCVRYRYDQKQKKRYKTVELIEEVVDWEPKEFDFDEMDKTVFVRIGYKEMGLRERVKAAGGLWDPNRKLWKLMYSQAVHLGLIKRIAKD